LSPKIRYKYLIFRDFYVDPGADFYEQQYRQRTFHYLEKKAQSLGFELVPHSPAESAS
jgi:transposase